MRRVETAVVILNWNGEALMRRYLPSVVNSLEDENAAVVVADNGSTDASLRYVEETFPQVEIVRLERNYGFAKGYNEAFKKLPEVLEADYYVLLNDDVETPKGWLAPLVGRLRSDLQCGAVMPKVLSARQREYFEHAGASGGFIDWFGFPYCRGRLLATVEKDEGQYDAPMEIHWATGACLAVRRCDYEREGGFEEQFFAHMEEIDLCWRMRRRGKTIWVEPNSTVYHLGGGTLGYESPRKAYLNHRNSLWMLRRNLRGGEKVIVLLLRVPMDLLAVATYVMKGNGRAARAALRAVGEGLFAKCPKPTGADYGTASRGGVWLLWQYFVLSRRRFSELSKSGQHA